MGCVLNLMGLWRPEAGNFSGMFGNANSLGSFMALVAPILMLKTYQALDQGRAVRIVHALFSMSFGVFLVLSRCRGGMVATVVACGWWLVFSYRRLFGLLVGGVAASALVLALYFPHYLESLDEVYVKKGSTYVTQSRENLMLDSWEAAKESPIIGVGFGVARGFSEAWEFEFETGSASREKVNSYLALIEEVGIVGSMFIVAPLLWVLVESARRLLLLAKSCPSSDEFLTTLTLSACFVGGLVNAFFEAWLTAAGFFSTVIFWLIFGALTARLTAPLGKTR